MPLIRVDAIDWRTEDQVRGVLDAVHRAVVSVFGVPRATVIRYITNMHRHT